MSQANDIECDAYAAWELKQFDEAAALFLQAAEAEAEAARTRNRWGPPDRSMLNAACSAFCLWEGGRNEEAHPTLETIAWLDFKELRLWGDRYDASTAFTYLLLDLAADGKDSQFAALWTKATERCRVLTLEFPFARPHKRMLIAACIETGHVSGVQQILSTLNPESLKDPELKLAAERGRRFVARLGDI